MFALIDRLEDATRRVRSNLRRLPGLLRERIESDFDAASEYRHVTCLVCGHRGPAMVAEVRRTRPFWIVLVLTIGMSAILLVAAQYNESYAMLFIGILLGVAAYLAARFWKFELVECAGCKRELELRRKRRFPIALPFPFRRSERAESSASGKSQTYEDERNAAAAAMRQAAKEHEKEAARARRRLRLRRYVVRLRRVPLIAVAAVFMVGALLGALITHQNARPEPAAAPSAQSGAPSPGIDNLRLRIDNNSDAFAQHAEGSIPR